MSESNTASRFGRIAVRDVGVHMRKRGARVQNHLGTDAETDRQRDRPGTSATRTPDIGMQGKEKQQGGRGRGRGRGRADRDREGCKETET